MAKKEDDEWKVQQIIVAMGKVLSHNTLERMFRDKWGISKRTFQRLLARARTAIFRETAQSRDEQKAHTIAVLNELLISGTTPKDRIAALKLRSEILGLIEPKIIRQQVIPTGGTTDAMTVEELRKQMLREAGFVESNLQEKEQHGREAASTRDTDADGLRVDGDSREVQDAEPPEDPESAPDGLCPESGEAEDCDDAPEAREE